MSGGAVSRYAPPRFQIGDRVTVLDLKTDGHIRTQNFLRNKTGSVVSYCGRYLNPEDLAVGRTSGPAVHLYRVVFEQPDLWPDYPTPTKDTLVTELYEHWLDAAEARPETTSA
jgi:nitrile hydratase